MAFPFSPINAKRFKLPFVSRSKYERMKQDCRDYRAACDYKQGIVMHYKTNYNRLHRLLTRPYDEKGRFTST